jgi:hypothetical protein
MEAYVFYSHYDYSDVWPLLFKQSERFLKGKRKYLITNNVECYDTEDWSIILYDDNDCYQERVWKSLQKIDEQIVIFHHEDMFLLDHPKDQIMKDLIQKVKDSIIDIVKLAKASYNHEEHDQVEQSLYVNPKNLSFAIQPTIIKKNTLINIYKATRGDSIWSFENNSNNYVNYMNFRSCYYYEGIEKKRGIFHWDSIVYPYIATAVVKGKWDYQCYASELDHLLQENNIDPNTRGKNV